MRYGASAGEEGCDLLSLGAVVKRRDFILGLGGAAVWPLAVWAQQTGRIPVVGIVWANADAEAAAA